MPEILVCDSESGYIEEVTRASAGMAGFRVSHAPGLSEAVKHVLEGTVDVLLLGPSVRSDDALVAIRTLRDSGTTTAVIVVASEVTTDLLRSALRAGADDVLASDAPITELAQALKDASDKSERRSIGGQDAETSHRPATVVTVFSTKGGVGKTVVSTNLAVALAQAGKAVALVDLDLHFGDVGIMLGLEPKQTIVGAVQGGDRLDSEMLSGFLVSHSSGLKVLLAPTRPEDAEMVTVSRIDRILALLGSMFDFVVVDTPPSLDESVLTALDRSDRVIAITMMDVASVKNSRVSLQKLRQLGYNGSLIDIMLNRADSKVYLNADNVEQAIGVPIKFRLPSDQQIPRSVNKGIPVVLEAPRSHPARVLVQTAQSIIDFREEVAPDVA